MTGKTREKSAGTETYGRNLTVRLAAVLGVLLALLGILLFLAPRLANMEPVKNRILDGLSRQIGGTVTCERIALSFFPAPALAFHNLEVASPENYQGKARRLAATLKGRSLLAGRVEIAALVLEDPDVWVTLAGRGSPGGKEDPFSPLSFLKDGTTIPGKTLPGQISVRSGRFEISGPGRDPLLLENVEFHLFQEVDAARFDASCRSAFWKQLTLGGEITEEGRKIVLAGPLEGFEPEKLFLFFNLPEPFQTGPAGLDLRLDFQITRFEKMTGTITWETLSLANRTGPDPVTVTAAAVTADLALIFPAKPPPSGSDGPPSSSRISGTVKAGLVEGTFGNTPRGRADGDRQEAFHYGKASFEDMTVSWDGPLLEPGNWRYTASGTLDRASLSWENLPGEVRLSGGRASLKEGELSLHGSEAALGGSRFVLDGSLKGLISGRRVLDTKIKGSIGKEAALWLSRLAGLPEGAGFRYPLTVSDGRVRWDDTSRGLSLEGVAIEKGPRFDLAMVFPPEGFRIKKLEIDDGSRRAFLDMTMKKEKAVFSYQGQLAVATLGRVFVTPPWLDGTLEGRVGGTVVPRAWWRSSLEGKAAIEGLTVPLVEGSNLRVLSAPVVFDRNGLHLEKAVLELDEKPLVLKGSIGTGEEGVDLNLEIEGNEIRWEELPGLNTQKESVAVEEESSREPPIRGTVSVSLKTLRYGSLAWQPFEADVTITGRQVSTTVRNSRLCGISTPGTLLYGPDGFSLHMRPSAAGQPLEETLSCLLGDSRLASGTLSGDGDIKMKGRGKDLLGSLSGTAWGTAEKGRIYRMNLLARILAVVNITEILRGKLPDIVAEGFAYDSALVTAVFENGSCLIEEGVIDGTSVEIAFTGKIDLPSETMDVTVAVAPLKTADFVVKKIPVIRDILGGNLVAIPVRVAGNLKDPSVIPLEPSAVGAGLLGILKRTLKLPVRLIEPLLPENP